MALDPFNPVIPPLCVYSRVPDWGFSHYRLKHEEFGIKGFWGLVTKYRDHRVMSVVPFGLKIYRYDKYGVPSG